MSRTDELIKNLGLEGKIDEKDLRLSVREIIEIVGIRAYLWTLYFRARDYLRKIKF